jgi:hypothetical protein
LDAVTVARVLALVAADNTAVQTDGSSRARRSGSVNR